MVHELLHRCNHFVDVRPLRDADRFRPGHYVEFEAMAEEVRRATILQIQRAVLASHRHFDTIHELILPERAERSPMSAQLTWRKANDWLLIGSSRTGRDVYEIRRQLDYDQHPAVRWRYLPKCIADGRAIPGTFHDSTLARQACEDDLQQLQQAAATTKG